MPYCGMSAALFKRTFSSQLERGLASVESRQHTIHWSQSIGCQYAVRPNSNETDKSRTWPKTMFCDIRISIARQKLIQGVVAPIALRRPGANGERPSEWMWRWVPPVSSVHWPALSDRAFTGLVRSRPGLRRAYPRIESWGAFPADRCSVHPGCGLGSGPRTTSRRRGPSVAA